jgi:hypothetical protein
MKVVKYEKSTKIAFGCFKNEIMRGSFIFQVSAKDDNNQKDFASASRLRECLPGE